jgi:hypothetical protein
MSSLQVFTEPKARYEEVEWSPHLILFNERFSTFRTAISV